MSLLMCDNTTVSKKLGRIEILEETKSEELNLLFENMSLELMKKTERKPAVPMVNAVPIKVEVLELGGRGNISVRKGLPTTLLDELLT